jgi:DNA-binding transcriptional MerR regulator/methylmalonyl-CoA mutase cobalamin-binding subunit
LCYYLIQPAQDTHVIVNTQLYSIGVIERDTGIARDTLRVWERRYGFPDPVRNEKGERIYPEIQLRRLQRIRRLLDRGIRPGKLLPLDEDALDQLEASLDPEEPEQLDKAVREILDAVRSADAGQVEIRLRGQYEKQGMQGFILETMVPLLRGVGDLWIGGKLEIFQEHFLSGQLIRFLNTEIAGMQKSAGKPLVLLATLPGEEHTLGLLMLAAILSSRGITAINLGGEVPMDQIGQAAQQFNADAVGITFSGSYQHQSIRPHVHELRELIAKDVEIWIGGEGVHRLRKLPAGVFRFNSLENIPISSSVPGKH